MPRIPAALASTLALGLAACATPRVADGGGGTPPTPALQCKAEAAQAAVGQPATTQLMEQARKDAGAATVRALRPGQAITMEFNGGRLNLMVDERNVVTSVRCG